MWRVFAAVNMICAVLLVLLTAVLTIQSGSFRNVVAYHYDENSIPCSAFHTTLVTEFPTTYPELVPLQKEILARAKQRHYINLKDGRLMQNAVEQVQKERETKQQHEDTVKNKF